jgi:hypothetical protein
MSEWLKKFRDDPADPRWLDKFPDDPDRPRPRPHPSQHPPQPRRPQRPEQQKPPGERGMPQSIMLFAALMAFSLVIGLTATAIALPHLAAGVSAWDILIPDVIVIAIIGALVALIAWLRFGWAVWLLAAFCAVRFVMFLPGLPHIATLQLQSISVFYFILQGAAFWFVFRPASRNWLQQKH